MGKENQNFIYGLEGQRWLRLDISDDGLQLFANSDNTPNSLWNHIDFPEVLTAWDPENHKTYRYFMHEGKLHRYFQIFNVIPTSSFRTDNANAINKINEILSRVDGFVATNNQNQKEGRGQFIQIYDDGDWEFVSYVPSNAKKFYIKSTEYSFNQTTEKIPEHLLLPKTYTPPSLPPVPVPESLPVEKPVSNADWYQERKVLPNFQLPLETTLPSSISWQLDNSALTLLFDFKGTTNTKQEYLSFLEIILGNESVPEHLRKNSLLINVARLRSFIRKPELNLDYIEKESIILNIQNELNISCEEAEKTFQDRVSIYLLTLVKNEYEIVSGKGLPFQIDINKPPQVSKENEQELDKALRLYQNFLSDNHYGYYGISLLHEAYEICCRMQPNNLSQNEYNYIAHWMASDPTENRRKFLLTYIVKNFYRDINEADLEKLLAYDLNETSAEDNLLQKYRAFYLALHSNARHEFVRDLEKHHQELNDNQLCNLGLIHPDVAVALVSHQFIWGRKIDIGNVCVKHKAVALLLFENTDLFQNVSISKDLPKIIENDPVFKTKLFANIELLINYDVDKLVEIAKIDNDFAQKFFKDNRFSQKFNIENWVEVAKANRDFSMLIFEEEYQSIVNQLNSKRIYIIATNHKDFMLKSLDHLLKHILELPLDDLQILSITHHEFGIKLLHSSILFSQFSKPQIIAIAKGNENFALALLDEQNSEFFNTLSVHGIYAISEKSNGFAEKFLETHEEKFREFSPWQLSVLVTKYPTLAKKLIADPTRLLRFSNAQIIQIVSVSKDSSLVLLTLECTEVMNRLTNNDLFRIGSHQVDFALRLISDESLKHRLGIDNPESLSEEAIKGLEFIGCNIETVIALMALPKLFMHAAEGYFSDNVWDILHSKNDKNRNISLLVSHLLNQWDLVSNLTNDQLYKIAEINLDFALRLLEETNLVTRLNTFHAIKSQWHSDEKRYLCEIALKHSEFTITLITDEKHADLLADFSSQELRDLCLAYKNFAESLIEKPALLNKLEDNDINTITKKYPVLEVLLLKKRKFSGKLSRDQSARLAILDVDHAIEFIRDPINIWFDSSRTISEIVNAHPEKLAAVLYREPEILNNLDPVLVNRNLLGREKRFEHDNFAKEYMSAIANLKVDFVTLFRERPKLLNDFTLTTISVITYHHVNFAMHLLNEHPEHIQKMSAWWLDAILCQHREFFDACLLKTNFESSTARVKENITSAYFKRAKDEDVYAQSLFRNRQFLSFNSDWELGYIIEHKPGRALALLQDKETFLDELTPDHLATPSRTGDGTVTNYLTDEYCRLALSNREIAVALFNRLQFLAKFSQSHLQRLAEKFPELVLNIDLNSKVFDIVQLSVFAKHSPQFAVRLLLDTTILDHKTSDFYRECALLSYNFALAMIKKPAIIKKLVAQEDYDSLRKIGIKYPNFINELVKSPEAFAALDRWSILALLPNNPSFNDITYHIESSNGFKICHNGTSFREFTAGKKSIRFTGNFKMLRNIMLDNLQGYNAHIYFKQPSEEQPTTFSRECLDTVAQSKNIDELRKTLNTEKTRMETLLSNQNRLQKLFSHTPAHLTWLTYCLKTCDNFRLISPYKRMRETLREFFDANNMKDWLDQNNVPADKRLPIVLTEEKTSLFPNADKSTLASVLQTDIKNERIVAISLEIKPNHWIAITLRINSESKLLACNFIDPTNDDKENKPEYLDEMAKQLKLIDPDYNGNLSQYSLGSSPCDKFESAIQMPVLLRSLTKTTLDSNAIDLELIAEHPVEVGRSRLQQSH